MDFRLGWGQQRCRAAENCRCRRQRRGEGGHVRARCRDVVRRWGVRLSVKSAVVLRIARDEPARRWHSRSAEGNHCVRSGAEAAEAVSLGLRQPQQFGRSSGCGSSCCIRGSRLMGLQLAQAAAAGRMADRQIELSRLCRRCRRRPTRPTSCDMAFAADSGRSGRHSLHGNTAQVQLMWLLLRLRL